ncbi:MAG: hypothetical protein ACREID_06195 [Planctomycetota bacterium]
MRVLQRFFSRVLPRRWAASMEAESRTWVMRCRCGHETSIWEMGGIRWKAAGTPLTLGRCAACGRMFLGLLRRRRAV